MIELRDDYLTVTPKLKAHWLKAVQPEQHDGLRASFTKGGCSGQELKFALVNRGTNSEDSFIRLDENTKLYLDRTMMHVFAGGTLDLVEEGISEIVKFEGPNLGGGCGCGLSYNIDSPK
jgi:iron-sulfur cluster assembly protein